MKYCFKIILKCLKKILAFPFPLITFIDANKKINKRIKNIDNGKYTNNNFVYVDNYKSYSYNQILPFYEKTLQRKKLLEDKAKISVIGITISTTIIIGLSGFLLKFNINFGHLNFFNLLLIILCIYLIYNINIAGILALLVIGNKNKVYQLFPQDNKLTKRKQAIYLAIFTEQNTNFNTIRQNYVYSSYLHLIYSIVILSLLFVLIAFNFNNKNNNLEVPSKPTNESSILLELNNNHFKLIKKIIKSNYINKSNRKIKKISLIEDKKIQKLHYTNTKLSILLIKGNTTIL